MGGKRTIKIKEPLLLPCLCRPVSDRRKLIGLLLVLLAVSAAYSNHFQNSFHFDDWHTVVGNVSIQNVRNLPRFFVDPSLFSTLPTHQVYQPVTSATLAIDYWLGGGLNPLYFHLITFAWFLIMLVLLFLLFQRIMDQADQHPSNWQFALLATACYGLHPAIAKTVNYIIQRADIYSTLGVVAALVLYMYWPASRKWGWYLLPGPDRHAGQSTALMFPLILLAYVCGTRGFSRLRPKSYPSSLHRQRCRGGFDSENDAGSIRSQHYYQAAVPRHPTLRGIALFQVFFLAHGIKRRYGLGPGDRNIHHGRHYRLRLCCRHADAPCRATRISQSRPSPLESPGSFWR